MSRTPTGPLGDGWLTTTQAAAAMGLTRHAVASAARSGTVPGAQRTPGGGVWMIPAAWAERQRVPPGYVRLAAVARRFGLSHRMLCREARGGHIEGALRKDGGRREWYVPAAYQDRLAQLGG